MRQSRLSSNRKGISYILDKQLSLYHKHKIDNKGIFRISGSGIENLKIYKAKKFASRSLKGKGAQSGIRIIYAYYDEEDKIEFIEIYYKGDKENEDRERILRYCREKGMIEK